MPFYFQARPYSSLDPISETTIPRPRIGPIVLENGLRGTEYQFAIYRGETRIGGVGFDGWDETARENSQSVHVFFFDLGRATVIRAMLSCKDLLGNVDDDFTYLQGLAQGFVLSFAGRTDNDEPLRYVAVTTSQALIESQVAIPMDFPLLPDGTLVLASVDVPTPGTQGISS